MRTISVVLIGALYGGGFLRAAAGDPDGGGGYVDNGEYDPEGAYEGKVLYEKESLYHYIRVTESGGVRHLQFRRSGADYEESAIDLKDPLRFDMYHYGIMFAAFAHKPDPERVLFIGLGGGTLPMAIHHYFPRAHIDNIELDPDVAHAAKAYFGFKEGPRMTLYIRDGRVQVRRLLREKKHYDIIMIDVFRGGYIPYHMTTKEFMEQLKGLLTDGGVVATNLRPGFASYHYHRRTLASAFAHEWGYGSNEGSNVVVVTDTRTEAPHHEELVATAERLQKEKQLRINLPDIVKRPKASYEKTGPVLTDDYAPTDVLRGIPQD